VALSSVEVLRDRATEAEAARGPRVDAGVARQATGGGHFKPRSLRMVPALHAPRRSPGWGGSNQVWAGRSERSERSAKQQAAPNNKQSAPERCVCLARFFFM